MRSGWHFTKVSGLLWCTHEVRMTFHWSIGFAGVHTWGQDDIPLKNRVCWGAHMRQDDIPLKGRICWSAYLWSGWHSPEGSGLLGCIPEVRMTFPWRVWLAGVLGVVEDKHVARGRLGCDDTRILRHETCAVDLAFVVDLDLNLDLTTHTPEATELWRQN